jgi:preprotein translocase subunit SecG
MSGILLIIHLLIALALVGVVLLQRSEGGALGIGGGGGGGGGGAMFSSRGAANVLTRATAGLAAAFFVTSITLTILARGDQAPRSVFEGNALSRHDEAVGQSQDGSVGVVCRLGARAPQVAMGRPGDGLGQGA